MQTVRSPKRMQRLALQWREQGRRIGFVPTMGCLHEGHLSLIRRARKAVGPEGRVIVSVYVNPTQFGPREDLDKYPRNLRRDLALCRKEGVDAVFAPSDKDIYPPDYSVYVTEEKLSQKMEGRSRPTHFRGVTTIVAKLFNLTQPHVAVFGAKDYQQAMIVRRMIRDLHFPIRLILAPTIREPDGLAMSSRNNYLDPKQRAAATVLWETIRRVRRKVRQAGKPLPAEALRREALELISSRPEARPDYVEFFDPNTLEPLQRVGPGAHMALAVFLGETRLIDNARL
ncbi:MAG: pantoate--beta-alanine ligase [Verrucomicrobia bacterium]|nr:pantoate--beta-alanine ligase [Verrucomicrobiota bacterium]